MSNGFAARWLGRGVRRGEHEGADRRRAMGTVAIAAVVIVSGGVSPGPAAATIDVQFIEFFKGLDRFSGQTPLNSGFFVELCLEATDVTTAEVRRPDSTVCQMDDFIAGNEYCCEEQFDTQQALDAAYPTGPGQNYTVTINGVGGPDTEVVEFDVSAPTAYTEITAPAPGANIDTSAVLTVNWVLTGCAGAPASCADGIALFVSETMGVDEDVVEDDTILITETTRNIPADTLQPNTEYRIEVETFRGTEDVMMTTDGLADSYELSIFYEDINSIVVPEPNLWWSQGLALALLGSVAVARRHR